MGHSSDTPTSDTRCSFSVLAGPGDASFVKDIVGHLMRTQKHKFSERVLVIDTLPTGRGRENTAALTAAADELVKESSIDRVIRLDAFARQAATIDRKHFGRMVRWDRDFRGVPLRGWVAGLEASTAPYHVHYDSDILLHQHDGYSWVAAGMSLLAQVPDLVAVAPHPGPPAPDGVLRQLAGYETDPRGFFRFGTFSSRRFLVQRDRFERLLPLRPRIASRRHMIRSWLGKGSPILNWELMVQERMQAAAMWRGNLTDHRAWSLHAPDHGHKFQTALPTIIERVEAGDFPGAQAGRYDLDMDAW